MGAAGITLALLVAHAVFGPRRLGRHLAKIVIGFRAQMRDEGEA